MKTLFTKFKTVFTTSILLSLIGLLSLDTAAQHSVAMQWNETQLNCIRKYFPKPTVHARNLFHASVVMYDAWAVYDNEASPFMLGNQIEDFMCPFTGIAAPADVQAAQEMAISYAMFRLLWNRYTSFAPAANLLTIQGYINGQMSALGYDPAITSTDYSDGDPAKLGNYIASQMNLFGQMDGSNQQNNYANIVYSSVNPQFQPQLPGNPGVVDPNRWQPMCLTLACAQGTGPGFPEPCVPMPCNAAALSPEWGSVTPFALTESQKSIITRDGADYELYLDPGAPPYLDTNVAAGLDESFFKWGFVTNIIWHSFHNNDDGVMIDISPASVGNLNITSPAQLPSTFEDYQTFYNQMEGGVYDDGYTVNPVTDLPYVPQLVPRKDFTRVLSQFWADGPNSETPPGHWFTLMNYVSNNPLFEKRWEGQGEILSDLEFDVKSYLALGGGIHDAAIACWGAKGAYDYTRPIFAIRYMGEKGQCTDENLPHYHAAGLPLMPGYIELVQVGDELAGENDENVNKIKIYSWRGPVAATGVDGAGWLLAENWWTYQTANFVTPPFQGYFSGHSTYSRSGAEILTRITGSEYFPGGMAEFHAPASTYLAADSGPSMDITLQWATYRDASDQCSLSRIYGGLHPPQDDLPGRKVGLVIGPQAFNKANELMHADIPRVVSIAFNNQIIHDVQVGSMLNVTVTFDEIMNTGVNPTIAFTQDNPLTASLTIGVGAWLADEVTFVQSYLISDANETLPNVVFQISGAKDLEDHNNLPAVSEAVLIDTENPTVTSAFNANGISAINDATVSAAIPLNIVLNFNEPMNVNQSPTLNFVGDDATSTLIFNIANSGWMMGATSYLASFDMMDVNEELSNIIISSVTAKDIVGNDQVIYNSTNAITIDTKNPSVISFLSNATLLNDTYAGDDLVMTFEYDETVDTSVAPVIQFPNGNPGSSILFNSSGSGWSGNTYTASYFTFDMNQFTDVTQVATSSVFDLAGNTQVVYNSGSGFIVDTQNPFVTAITSTTSVIADVAVGVPFMISIAFNEAMNTDILPVITFQNGDPLMNTLIPNGTGWVGNTFTMSFIVNDANETINDIGVLSVAAEDMNGNIQTASVPINNVFRIDTKNPNLLMLSANTYNITGAYTGTNGFTLLSIFDEPMDDSSSPGLTFPVELPSALTVNADSSGWINATTYKTSYNVAGNLATLPNIDVHVGNTALDAAGNPGTSIQYSDFFSINIIVSVNEFTADNQPLIYPNPVEAGRILSLEWPMIPSGLTIDMYNSVGALVLSQGMKNSSEKRISLDISDLVPGMYFIRVNSNEGRGVYNVSIAR